MKSTKTLLVDDDRNFAKSMAVLLRGYGYDVDVANDGKEAVEKFSRQDYAIAFMDVCMPAMNGVESFFEIRKLRPDANVMLMTAFTVEQILEQAIEAGALGVLSKPLNIGKALEAIEAAMPAGIILIADDDPNFTESLRLLLSSQNYSVLIAATGAEAVEMVLNNGVDVLILDLRLPLLSGLEVYLELKKQGRVVPTVIVTGYATEEAETLDLLRQMSVTGILRKPFGSEQLILAIEALKQEPE
jgi:two-component system response regulator HydG